MSELLRMEHISKRFGNFYANQDINFSVAKGEVHTLLGENGAGEIDAHEYPHRPLPAH